MKIQKNYSLAHLTTYQIGGPAEFFIAVTEKNDLEAAFAWAREQGLPITILGGGSNILIADQEIKGLVIQPNNERLEISDKNIFCGCGVTVKKVSEMAFEKSLSGVEWSIGIPGAMGGAIRGNAGAHGGAFDNIVQSVTAFDSKNVVWADLEPDQCGFAYRHSKFKDEPHWIVWEVLLRLKASEDKSAMEKAMNEYRQYRIDSQPREPSCGCIFKNLFAKDIEAINPELVQSAEQDNKVRGGKIGAGYLIQKLGLMGRSRGGAEVSTKHANFIVNKNKASAEDVVVLAEEIKLVVKEKFNILLEEEVQYLGF